MTTNNAVDSGSTNNIPKPDSVLQLYSVFDVVDGSYSFPFVAGSDGAATRSFTDSLGSSDPACRKYASHPADFQLFYLGYFNATKGLITSAQPRFIYSGASYKPVKPASGDVKVVNPST